MWLEPTVAVVAYLAAAAALQAPLSRPDVLLCLLTFVLRFPGVNHFHEPASAAGLTILRSWLGFVAVLGAVGWASRSLHFFDPAVLQFWGVAAPLSQWLAFCTVKRLLRLAARQAGPHRRVVVVGAGALGTRVAHALRARDGTAVQVLGFVDDRLAGRVDAPASARRLGDLADLARLVRDQGVHEVYITLPLGSHPRMAGLLNQLQGTTASIYLVPDVCGVGIIQGRLQELSGMPLVGLCTTPFTGVNRLAKRLCDLVLASLILALVAPLLLALAVGVKLSSPGPVVFRQRRNGLDGDEIVVYKFRSMRTQDDGTQVAQATRNDARVTPFGAFMRRTSLDELPQFINVLQGRMSIVGPRPHAVAHNDLYRDLINGYMVRHKVKPGITGWAQVNGCRGETETVEKMRQRVAYDLEYLRQWSLGLDLLIVARTVRLVLFDRSAY